MALDRTRATFLVGAALLLAGCAAAGAGPVDSPGDEPATAPTTASSPTTALEGLASSAPAESAASIIPDRTVEQSGGFRLAVLTSASCTAEAPADWTMTAPDKSDRVDVVSPDGTRYAGYGIQAVNTTLQDYASAYAPPFDDPGLYSDDPGTVAVAYGQIIVAGIGGSADLVVEEAFQPSPDYLLLSVAGSTHRGGIFFHASGYPGDGYNYTYALPMYFAFSTHDQWDSQGLLTARVATSIRCVTQFQPPDDYFVVEASDPDAGADPNGDEAGYNPQLGTEYANDPDTGTNYLVDPSLNWSENGPDGPGYYVTRGGGDYGKLEPGRID